MFVRLCTLMRSKNISNNVENAQGMVVSIMLPHNSGARRSAAAEAQQARQLVSQLAADGGRRAAQAHANHAAQEACCEATDGINGAQHNLQGAGVC